MPNYVNCTCTTWYCTCTLHIHNFLVIALFCRCFVPKSVLCFRKTGRFPKVRIVQTCSGRKFASVVWRDWREKPVTWPSTNQHTCTSVGRKMADTEAKNDLPTISDDLVVTKYKMAAEIVNSKWFLNKLDGLLSLMQSNRQQLKIDMPCSVLSVNLFFDKGTFVSCVCYSRCVGMSSLNRENVS